MLIGWMYTNLRWSYEKDPERAARMKEKDLQTLAEKNSKYAGEMQKKYPTGSIVVSQEDLAGALCRAPERMPRALALLHSY